VFPPVVAIGPVRVAWYSLLMSGGLLAALLWLAWADPEQPRLSGVQLHAGSDQRPLRRQLLRLTAGWPAALRRALDDALPLFFSALGAGRTVYVLAQWAYFREHPLQALYLWEGGLSAHGALAGFLAALAWRARRQPGQGAAADRFTPPLLLLQTAAWLSCWCAGCAYGRPVDIVRWPWLTAFDWPDLYGVFLPRAPVQGLGVILSLALLMGVLRLRTRGLAPGMLASVALFLGALTDAGLQLLRGDEAWLWLGQRAGLGADLLFMAAAATWFVLAWRGRLAQKRLSC